LSSLSSKKSTVATTVYTTKTSEDCYTSTVMTTKVYTSEGSYVTHTVPLYTTTITYTKTFVETKTFVQTKPATSANVYPTGGHNPKPVDEHVYSAASTVAVSTTTTKVVVPTTYLTTIVSYPTGGKANSTATSTGGYKPTTTPIYQAGSAKTMAFSLGGALFAAVAAVMAL
jgi:hypothetical protein